MAAIDKIRRGVDKANGKLAAQGLGGRLYDVTVSTYVEGNDEAGTAGTWGAPLTLTPRPVTKIKAVMRFVDGGLVKVGDVEVRAISRATYTEAQLRGAIGATPTRWTIDGVAYSLVELRPEPTEWIAVLQKEGE